MAIACLGWGSLIWDPRDLPLRSRWRRDGPELPVEFARQSKDDRITLVILQGVPPVRVLWAEMNCSSAAQGRGALASREETAEKNIGLWTKGSQAGFPYGNAVAQWAGLKGLDSVVWTALPPKFQYRDGRIPTYEEVLKHLESLKGADLDRAKEYICRAPQQIATQYRAQIERSLGWIYDGTKTDSAIE